MEAKFTLIRLVRQLEESGSDSGYCQGLISTIEQFHENYFSEEQLVAESTIDYGSKLPDCFSEDLNVSGNTFIFLYLYEGLIWFIRNGSLFASKGKYDFCITKLDSNFELLITSKCGTRLAFYQESLSELFRVAANFSNDGGIVI